MPRKPWNQNVVRIERLDRLHFRLFLECGHHVDQRWQNIGGDEVIADPAFQPSATIRTCPECKATHTSHTSTSNAQEDEPLEPVELSADEPQTTVKPPEAPPQPSGELVIVPLQTCEPSFPSPLTLLSKKDFAACAKQLSPEQLLCNIKHSHEQAQMSFGRGVEWGFTCGLYLLWMKEKMLKHGEYESWVNDRAIAPANYASRKELYC